MSGFYCPTAKFVASWSVDLAISPETPEDLLPHLKCVEIAHKWGDSTATDSGTGTPDSEVIKVILSSMARSPAVPDLPSFG